MAHVHSFRDYLLSPAAVEYREWQMFPHVPWPCGGDCVPWLQSLQYAGGHRQYGHYRQTLECRDWHRAMHTHCELGREGGRGEGEGEGWGRRKGRRGVFSLRIWWCLSLCAQGHSAEVICVNFSTTGDLTLTGSFDNTVNIWDTATGE